MKKPGAGKKLPYGHASRNALFYLYKKNAERRGVLWYLTKEEFNVLTSQDCAYCGLQPSNVYRAKGKLTPFVYSGIDRVDNTAGYIAENAAPCCWMCNEAKKAHSLEEWASWLARISKKWFTEI